MNRKRFLEVAGEFEMRQWGSYVRNREARTEEQLDLLFEEWWAKSWTAPELKKTEAAYAALAEEASEEDVMEYKIVADTSWASP